MNRDRKNDWLRRMKVSGELSTRTIGLYEGCFKKFERYLEENEESITTDSICDFLYCGLDEENWSRSYYNNNLKAIKSYCKWVAIKEQISNPANSIKLLKVGEQNQRILSEEEYAQLLDIAEGLDRDIVLFLGNTGLRATEFCSLSWNNVAEDLSAITFTGKGMKVRTVPMNKICREILLKHKGSNGHSGKLPFSPKNRYGLTTVCVRLARIAGVKRFGPHAFRHRLATQLIRKGVPLKKVSMLLGHGSVQTTERIYCHLAPIDLMGITDCLLN